MHTLHSPSVSNCQISGAARGEQLPALVVAMREMWGSAYFVHIQAHISLFFLPNVIRMFCAYFSACFGVRWSAYPLLQQVAIRSPAAASPRRVGAGGGGPGGPRRRAPRGRPRHSGARGGGRPHRGGAGGAGLHHGGAARVLPRTKVQPSSLCS